MWKWRNDPKHGYSIGSSTLSPPIETREEHSTFYDFFIGGCATKLKSKRIREKNMLIRQPAVTCATIELPPNRFVVPCPLPRLYKQEGGAWTDNPFTIVLLPPPSPLLHHHMSWSTQPPFATALSHHHIATRLPSPVKSLGHPPFLPLLNICIYLINAHSMLFLAMGPEIVRPGEFRGKSAARHRTSWSAPIPAMLLSCLLVSFQVRPASKCRPTATFIGTRTWLIGYSASFFGVVCGLVWGRRGRRESRHEATSV